MSRVNETQSKVASIRKKPLSPKLHALLDAAAVAAGIDEVVVFSGGQRTKASGEPRTGSDRHDNGGAGDLKLKVAGRTLNFEVAADRVKVAAFVTACAARGATGIGAAVGYMGPESLHVGFGDTAVWGAGGKSANAPQWLRDAAAAGWKKPVAIGKA